MSRWVLDYPEATSKYNQYKTIVDSLQGYQIAIDAAAGVIISSISNLTDSTGSLEGTYYNEYSNAVTNWWNRADLFRTDFRNASAGLKTRISNAEKSRNMWSARIGVGHWEED